MKAESEGVADVLHRVHGDIGEHHDLLLGLDSANDLRPGTDPKLPGSGCRCSGPLSGVLLVGEPDGEGVLHARSALGIAAESDDMPISFRDDN